MFQGRKVYLILPAVEKPQGVNYDRLFMNTLKTFQPMREMRTKQSEKIHYVKPIKIQLLPN